MYNNKIDNNRKTRHDWVDALKFLGIFAIYLGHLGLGAGKLYPFVFSYHVPLFFFA
ncbi:acyltransferase, partial [Shigella flexneri]|nr:acyltransferase [Shigella flexneri]